MPNEPRLVDQHLVEGDGSNPDIVILEKHEAPSTVEGNPGFDPFYDFDQWRARRIMEALQQEYPGHFWCVVSDKGQGIVKISIPILMGINNWFVINERTHDITPGMIVVAGGEILERYSLQRGRLNVGSFLQARAKHSALVMPSRKVPT